MNFAECVVAGAAMGFKAFFAALVFTLCAGIALGLLVALARVFGGNEE